MAGKKILVVEDEVPVAMVIRANLQSAGYKVVEAYTGLSGWQKAQQEKPDVVVLDVMLPELNGWGVLKRIRADESLRDTPVVMLTALTEDADVAKGWELGADIYLPKPFEPDALVSVVNRLLSARGEEQAAAPPPHSSEQS